MGVVMFYHLTRSSPEETLLALLPRALAQGWRVMIRGTDPARLDRLDSLLWTDPPDSFLPHGREGGPQDARQPVLLGQGAAVTPEEARPMERVWLLFDGGDGAAVQAARGKWKTLTAAGLTAQYWSEESGRWEKKADSAAKG